MTTIDTSQVAPQRYIGKYGDNTITYEVFTYDNTYDEYGGVVNYVIYSHSSYFRILEIQTDYMCGRGHLTLFIDKNDLNLTHIYRKYDAVIFYDEKLPYGQRLLTCINQINYDYFVMIHDIDILFHINIPRVLGLIRFLKTNNFDRVDFQLARDFDITHGNIMSANGLYLVKSTNTDTTANGYIYNVNPSIWRREPLIKILEKYGNKDYREIEATEVQNFCLQFKIFKLFSKTVYRCGYFICLEPFKYLHITHGRKLLSLDNLSDESSVDIKKEYEKIISKYNLQSL